MIYHISETLTQSGLSHIFLLTLQPNIHVHQSIMEIEFLGQGFDPTKNKPLGLRLLQALTSNEFNEFICFSAFVSSSGVINLKDALINFINEGNKVNLYVGVDLHGTSKEALEMLIAEDIPTTIVYSPNSIVYHPKIYLLRGERKHMIVVGSSNLTGSGLFQNIEASLCISFLQNDLQGIALEESVLDFFDSLISSDCKSANLLSSALLDILVKSNLVLPESTSRSAQNKVNNMLPKVSCQHIDEVKSKFKKLIITRPPKGYKKVVKREIISTTDSTVETETTPTVVYESSIIEGSAMWIESGKMTGGSRNILDLSKQGKQDGVERPGSVEFFGVDKDNYTIEKDIAIEYNGIVYLGNTIKYAPRNSNWRIQLKGLSVEGDKFTDILRAAGSQNRVFVFEHTANVDVYKFHILDPDDVGILKDQSVMWANGGRSGNGRQYGIING